MNKLIINILLLTMFFNLTAIETDIDSAYSNLRTVLPYKMISFFRKNNALYLEKFIKDNNFKVIVELGSWLGTSTIFLSNIISDDAKIYAVDTWQGSEEHFDDIKYKDLLPNLYDQFLSNIIHHKQQNKVVPIRLTTISAAKYLDITPDLIYVDAAHDEISVYNDIKTWYKKLKVGGIICGDDWEWPSVKNGVEKIAKELGQTIYSDNSIWWFEIKK